MARGFMSIILFLAMLFSGGKSQNTDDIDGGVVHNNTDPDAPKVIESDEIVSFECEISFIATVFDEQSELEGRVYKLSAVLNDDDVVKVKNEWRDRSGSSDKTEFKTDISFMTELQQIVKKHDLAGLNGHSRRVTGLPDMYGAKLDVEYASGESIYAYNNQDCFITVEASEEIISLFCEN